METQTKTKWAIDPLHSEVGFKIKHMMISTVRGNFNEFTATVDSDRDDFVDADIEVEINVASINTNNQDRDNHLKSDDFFNAESYPVITFKSKSYEGGKLIGDLTIRDVTKEVVLDVDYNGTVVDPYGQTKAGFEISGEINRKDFGLKWSALTEAGAVVVSEQVKLAIGVQLVKQG